MNPSTLPLRCLAFFIRNVTNSKVGHLLPFGPLFLQLSSVDNEITITSCLSTQQILTGYPKNLGAFLSRFSRSDNEVFGSLSASSGSSIVFFPCYCCFYLCLFSTFFFLLRHLYLVPIVSSFPIDGIPLVGFWSSSLVP